MVPWFGWVFICRKGTVRVGRQLGGTQEWLSMIDRWIGCAHEFSEV
jgi:hypothetical protein